MKPWVALILVLPAAGCVGSPGQDILAPQGSDGPGARVVVALVDTGINPYHAAFRGTHAERMARQVLDANDQQPPQVVQLSARGAFADRHRADEAFWADVKPNQLYAFTGTNVLAISVMDPTATSLVLDEGTTWHGTGIASLVSTFEPAPLVVMVEAWSTRQVESTLGSELRGLRWAIAQPWIDVISISFGFPLNYPGFEGIPEILRDAVDAGKLVVVAAGNLPSLTPADTVAGPPWVIAAGGGDSRSGGEWGPSSKAPDFLADFAAMVAENDSVDGYSMQEGTSNSAPLVAGQVAKAIHQLRATAGHEGGIRDGALVLFEDRAITNTDLREAFNRTATYWQATDYRGPNLTEDPFTIALQASVPILPAPWLQMGWGYVGPGTAEAAAAHLLGIQEPAPKPPEAVAHMRAVDAARWAYWG